MKYINKNLIFIIILIIGIFYLFIYNNINNSCIENFLINENINNYSDSKSFNKHFINFLKPGEKNVLTGKSCGGIIDYDDMNNKVNGFIKDTPTGMEHTCPDNTNDENFNNDLIQVLLPKNLGGTMPNKLLNI